LLQNNLGDATILPGFIDCHVHMGAQMSMEWYKDFYEEIMRFPAEQALFAAKLYVGSGEPGSTVAGIPERRAR
jgi:cytosine/adenosine deaminase-related metal-dependent hydrolase